MKTQRQELKKVVRELNRRNIEIESNKIWRKIKNNLKISNIN